MNGDVTTILLETADPQGAEAIRLLHDMRAEALSRYRDVVDASPPITNGPLGPRSAFLIARVDGHLAGCAALQPIDTEVAEVRRMYVVAGVRRRGIARRLLAELERSAFGFGYKVIRLETGVRQPGDCTL